MRKFVCVILVLFIVAPGTTAARSAGGQVGFFHLQAGNLDPATIRSLPPSVPEDLWVAGEQRWWLGVTSGTVGLGYRQIRQVHGASSSDTLRFLQGLPLGNRYDAGTTRPLGIRFRDETFEALDVTAQWRPRSGLITAWVQASALSGRELIHVEGTGYGYGKLGSGDPAFHIQFTIGEARQGTGWSFGGGIAYHPPGYQLTLQVFDAVGQLRWEGVEVRRGIINSRTEIIGTDGYPSRAPLASGRRTIENWTDRPRPRWLITYGPRSATPSWLVTFESFGNDLRRLVLSLPWANNGYITLGGSFPETSVEFGFKGRRWELGVNHSFSERHSLGAFLVYTFDLH